MQAVWNNVVLAESLDTVAVEGNHYFPATSLNMAHFTPSNATSHCSWKGTAHYYDITVDGKVNRAAAWTYRTPKEAARHIAGRVAFWHGVEVS